MGGIAPVVRHMLVCEAYREDPADPLKVDVLGLRSVLHASGPNPFPFHAPPLLVLLRTSGGRGTGRCRVMIRHADTGKEVYGGKEYPFTFAPNPLTIMDLRLKIRSCLFPRPGLHVVQFLYEDKLTAQELLLVR
jgi:hypothetical protein